jgi:hypothetical protein
MNTRQRLGLGLLLALNAIASATPSTPQLLAEARIEFVVAILLSIVLLAWPDRKDRE